MLDNDKSGGYTHEVQHEMVNPERQPRVTSFAPQFLVGDLARSMAYYQKLGFAFGEPWDGFYAIGELDGRELHHLLLIGHIRDQLFVDTTPYVGVE